MCVWDLNPDALPTIGLPPQPSQERIVKRSSSLPSGQRTRLEGRVTRKLRGTLRATQSLPLPDERSSEERQLLALEALINTRFRISSNGNAIVMGRTFSLSKSSQQKRQAADA